MIKLDKIICFTSGIFSQILFCFECSVKHTSMYLDVVYYRRRTNTAVISTSLEVIHLTKR